jgi:hypothetical protein
MHEASSSRLPRASQGGMTALIFATSLVDSSPGRYQGWIDYYSDFFRGEDVRLLLINDGPTVAKLDLKEAEQRVLMPHLGRQHVWVFPGWKRSFYAGLRYARANSIAKIAHIESDCFIAKSGKREFLNFLNSDGYFIPHCKSYDFPETALQILNSEWVVNYFLDRYSCEENWHEKLDFEKLVSDVLKPHRFLDGDRYEGKTERLNPNYNFLSGCVASDFLKLMGDK